MADSSLKGSSSSCKENGPRAENVTLPSSASRSDASPTIDSATTSSTKKRSNTIVNFVPVPEKQAQAGPSTAIRPDKASSSDAAGTSSSKKRPGPIVDCGPAAKKPAQDASSSQTSRKKPPPKTKQNKKNKRASGGKKTKASEAKKAVPDVRWSYKPFDPATVWAAPSSYDMSLPRKKIPDPAIDLEVDNWIGKTLDDAVRHTAQVVAEYNARGDYEPDWKVDYVIATTSNKANRKVVVKFTKFAHPSLVNIEHWFIPTTEEYIKFWRRNDMMNQIEKFLRKELRGQFVTVYPARFVKDEPGFSESAFVQDAGTMHTHRLRVSEWRVCFDAEMVNQPHLFFVDWTGLNDGVIPSFKYTNVLRPSKKVEDAMKGDDYSAISCNKSCKEHPCESALLNRKCKDSRSCKCRITRIVKSKGKKDKTIVDNSPVECTEKCKCDPKTCGNRIIQKGRQKEVVVFRHPQKGYCALACHTYKKNEFVGEYVGEVITTTEADKRGNDVYLMEMPNVRERLDDEKGHRKTHRKLIIDASVHGNETRFFSHSCQPNLQLVSCYVERYGGWFSRMAFIAKRDIKIGEELCFDYYPKMLVRDKAFNISPLFEICHCGAGSHCKFEAVPSEALKELRRKQNKDTEERKRVAREQNAEDSWDEEEVEKRNAAEKKLNSRAARNQRYNNRRSRTME